MIQLSGVSLGNITGGPSAINLSDLNDVSVVSPQTGQYLRYNGAIAEWQNAFLNTDVYNYLNSNLLSTSGITLNKNPTNETVTIGLLLTSLDITGALGYTPVNRAGDTMTGALILNADPTSNLGAATKQYVDANSGGGGGNYVSKTGDTMTGTLLGPQVSMDFVQIGRSTTAQENWYWDVSWDPGILRLYNGSAENNPASDLVLEFDNITPGAHAIFYRTVVSPKFQIGNDTESYDMTTDGAGGFSLNKTSDGPVLEVSPTGRITITNDGLDVTGDIVATGDITAFSDDRLKEDWNFLDRDLIYKLSRMVSGTFTRKDTGKRHVGVSAQSLQQIIPEAVRDENGVLSVAYGNAALAICASLAREIEYLREELNRIKGRQE